MIYIETPNEREGRTDYIERRWFTWNLSGVYGTARTYTCHLASAGTVLVHVPRHASSHSQVIENREFACYYAMRGVISNMLRATTVIATVSTFDAQMTGPVAKRRVLVRSVALMANTRHISDWFDLVRRVASMEFVLVVTYNQMDAYVCVNTGELCSDGQR